MQPRYLFIIASTIGIAVTGSAAYAKSGSTQDFVEKASIANEFEIESSNLALHKSRDSTVKSFAQRMVDDHTKTGEKLKEVLESSESNVQPVEVLDDNHQELLNKLDEASDRDFDREYISIQTDAHKEAVSLFSDYSKHGKNPQLKDFAAETLPTLKDHLKHVEQLKANH